MSPIYTQDGKILIIDGKIAADQKCCCAKCCIPSWIPCCQYVKWTLTLSDCVPSEQREQTALSPIGGGSNSNKIIIPVELQNIDCNECGSGSCKFYARTSIECNGFNICGNCNTDCSLSPIEYCIDPNDPDAVWSNNPTIACDCANIFESLTVEIDEGTCPEQPPADTGLPPRGLVYTGLTPEQCQNNGGEFCPDCESCKYACGSPPSEWRIIDIDNNDDMWFMGDIESSNDPNRCPIAENTVYMLDFPFLNCPIYCVGKCVSYKSKVVNNLKLQLLVGNSWVTAKKALNPNSDASVDSFFHNNTECVRENYSDIPVILPKEYRCLTYNGAVLECDDPYSDNYPCIECDPINIGYVCGNGLSYLDNGIGVKFTNRVDTNGGNSFNWEDANGNWPAGSLPGNLGGACGPETNDSIIIDGILDRWLGWGPSGPNLISDLSFDTVTLNTNSELAYSLTANKLISNNATIIKNRACDSQEVTITVTDEAILTNSTNNAIIEGNVTLNTSSKNLGTIDGNAIFNTGSWNGQFNPAISGIVTGNAEFNDNSINIGTVNGNATFNDDSINESGATVDENATFNNSAANIGTIKGDVEFNGENPYNDGLIEGNATFTRSSYTVTIGHPVDNGDLTFYLGGQILGTITFTSLSPVSFTLDNIGQMWTFDTSSWIFITSGQNWTLNNSTNMSVLKGNTTLNGSSQNWNGSTIDGNATFNNTSENAGHVTGTATFNDSSCNEPGVGTATIFVPDPPPSCW